MALRDEAWFERLYQRHRSRILAYCVRRMGAANASDAVSEVFAVAWRRRADVPDDPETLPWLYGAARHVLSHHWRRAGRATRLASKVGSMRRLSDPGPEMVVIERSEHVAVRQAVASLRPADREVLMLSAWEGLTHREIAAVVGCSQAAVDKRMTRAKTRLADRYRAMTETPPLSSADSNRSVGS